ncbi:hypothetical protein RDWZM_004453, partial [Blomia tropicalis]
ASFGHAYDHLSFGELSVQLGVSFLQFGCPPFPLLFATFFIHSRADVDLASAVSHWRLSTAALQQTTGHSH